MGEELAGSRCIGANAYATTTQRYALNICNIQKHCDPIEAMRVKRRPMFHGRQSLDQAIVIPKSRNTQILDLAFDIGLSIPRVTTGYERDGSKITMLTFGSASERKTMMFGNYVSLEEIERRIHQEVGHLPLTSVSRKSCSHTTSTKS